jgi:hypothetical protein
MSDMETVLKLKIDAADYRGPLLHAEFLGTIPLSVNAAEWPESFASQLSR